MAWRRGQAYAQDLRDRVLAAVDGGMRAYRAAKLFGVSPSYIYKALARRRVTGDSGPNPTRGHRPRKLSPGQERALATHIAAHPDLTLERLRDWLDAEHGVRLSSGGIWNAVNRLGLSFKKTLRADEHARPDVAARRLIWRVAQRYLDPERLVFLDESGVNTKMVRLYGRAPVGKRLFARAPFGHWKTMTFIAALRQTELTAPWVLEGAMDGEAFLCYIRNVLGPTLTAGDIVVMDNLKAHKVRDVVEALKAYGAQPLYLPQYSPDMNPIEMAFSKLKTALRAKPARTVDALYQRIGEIIDTFTPSECTNYFVAAGYQHSI